MNKKLFLLKFAGDLSNLPYSDAKEYWEEVESALNVMQEMP